MNVDQLNLLTDYLKKMSKLENNATERINISNKIKDLLILILLNRFYGDINCKETRIEVKQYLTDIFNMINLKNIKKVIIVCNELNNTMEIINKNDLVVDISIDFGEFLYNFKVIVSEYNGYNNENNKFLKELREQIIKIN